MILKTGGSVPSFPGAEPRCVRPNGVCCHDCMPSSYRLRMNGVSLRGVEFRISSDWTRVSMRSWSAVGFLIVFRMNASITATGRGGRAGDGHQRLPQPGRVSVAYTDGGALADLVSGYAECLRHSLHGDEDMAEIEVYLPKELTRQVMRYGNPDLCGQLHHDLDRARIPRSQPTHRSFLIQMASLVNAQNLRTDPRNASAVRLRGYDQAVDHGLPALTLRSR
jgi:hypothetical protein